MSLIRRLTHGRQWRSWWGQIFWVACSISHPASSMQWRNNCSTESVLTRIKPVRLSGRMTPDKILHCTLASLAILVAAENAPAHAQTEAPVSDARAAVAVRAEQAPRLDGTLDDPIWQIAPPIDDFRQREPPEAAPATEETEVRILYDARHVYFGIHCYDTAPAEIVATQLRRDLSMDLDDNFAVMIDPTRSHRNGYIFQVNPLGTQRGGGT